MATYSAARRFIDFVITYDGRSGEKNRVDGIVKEDDEFLGDLMNNFIEMNDKQITNLKIRRTIITKYEGEG